MDELEQIKQQIDIFELAEQFGAQPNARGKCKSNPLRQEKTSSLQLYRKTNSWNDFGGKGGSVIDFYSLATGKSLAESIKDLKIKAGIHETVITKPAPIPKTEFMRPEIVRKIFDKQIEFDFSDAEHKKILYELAPKFVIDASDEVDLDFFLQIARKAAHLETSMILLRDEHNVEKSLRYRRKMVGDEERKWYAQTGTESNFLYTRFTENPLTIVTEGTSDYLVAILLGFSVISLPSASYKHGIPLEFTKDRKLIFIGDDGEAGQTAIKQIFEDTVCEKKLFNYDEFRAKYNKEGTDFKDLVCEYTKTSDFLNDFNEYIETLEESTTDALDFLRKKGGFATRAVIADVENTKLLFKGLLASNQITTLVGAANVGKSALTLAISNYLMEHKEIDTLIYLDNDNNLSYTKDRIIKLMDRNGDDKILYYTGSTASRDEMLENLTALANLKAQGKKTLIVLDSFKDFVNGTVNSDESINEIFNILKSVRDNFGATIMALHHTKKGKGEDGKNEYVGSQAIRSSTDNMLYLDKKEDVLVVTTDKARAMLNDKMAFHIDFENMLLDERDVPVEAEEETKAELTNEWQDVKKLGGYDKVKADTNAEVKKIGNKWCARLKSSKIYVEETIYEPDLDAGMVL